MRMLEERQLSWRVTYSPCKPFELSFQLHNFPLVQWTLKVFLVTITFPAGKEKCIETTKRFSLSFNTATTERAFHPFAYQCNSSVFQTRLQHEWTEITLIEFHVSHIQEESGRDVEPYGFIDFSGVNGTKGTIPGVCFDISIKLFTFARAIHVWLFVTKLPRRFSTSHTAWWHFQVSHSRLCISWLCNTPQD